MKVQLVVSNSLGVFKSKSQELTQEEYDQLLSLVKNTLDYLTFIDENGNELVFKKDLIANSLIKIVKLDKNGRPLYGKDTNAEPVNGFR
jgi:uncharacterized protein YnzC (UPF0291/DUF896 family)